MTKISYASIVTNLENLFQQFNERFYDGELQKPIITVSPDTTSSAYGWCTSWKAWKLEGSDDGFYEINICAEYLNRPFQQLCGTLLHEMVHLYCLQHDIKDTSRHGKYHNSKFKEIAEKKGLLIEKHQTYGWTITSLNLEGQEFINTLNGDDFKLYRTKMVITKSKTSSSNSRKYVCPRCEMSIRATKEVRVTCTDCQVEMEEEE